MFVFKLSDECYFNTMLMFEWCIFILHYIERWSIPLDKNNLTVTVWFDVLVWVLDVIPDLMLPDILLYFENQHLFDTWDCGYTQHVTEIWEVHMSTPLQASMSYSYPESTSMQRCWYVFVACCSHYPATAPVCFTSGHLALHEHQPPPPLIQS